MKDRPVSVVEPFVAGGLFAGIEVLAVLGLPLWVLVFCVVHAVQVAETVRKIKAFLPADEQVDLWSVVVLYDLLLFSAAISFVGALILLVTVALGTLTWRLTAGLIGWGADRRSFNRYRTLAGGDEMAADAWDEE